MQAPGIAELGLAIFAGLMLGFAMLIVIHKMIDQEIEVGPGLGAIVLLLFLMAMCVKPTHPAVPAVIFVVTLTCMALIPFAMNEVAEAEVRRMGTERLIRAYDNLVQRPDNVSLVFEIASRLHDHGMVGNAIAISNATLQKLSTSMDPVHNRSQRDLFRNEEQEMRKWSREAAVNPKLMKPIPCPNCGRQNEMDALICVGCGRPYLIDIAHKMNIRPRIQGKIIFAFGAIASLIVFAAQIGLYFSGWWAALAFLAAVGGTGGILAWLFRKPKPI